MPSVYRLASAATLLVCCLGCSDIDKADPFVRPSHAAESAVANPAVTVAQATNLSLLPNMKWVDLTHPFDEQTIYWPTEDGFRLIREKAGITEKGYYYAANRFVAAEHGGTHLDAPIHFSAAGRTADQISLDRFIGPGVVIDVTASCQQDADYQVGISDFRHWETKHGRTLVDVIVLLRTGHSKHWADRKRYLGTEETGESAVAHLHFPGLDPAAAKWLAEHRSIKSIGIDTPSIDFGQSTHFESHVTLFAHDIPAFENVAHLEQLPEVGFEVVALPMKIGGGTGAPLRIVAALPSGQAQVNGSQ